MSSPEQENPLISEVEQASRKALQPFVGRELTEADIPNITRSILSEAQLGLSGVSRVIEELQTSRTTAYRIVADAGIPVVPVEGKDLQLYLSRHINALVEATKNKDELTNTFWRNYLKEQINKQ